MEASVGCRPEQNKQKAERWNPAWRSTCGKRCCVRSSSGRGLHPNPVLFSPDLLHRLLVGLCGRVEPLGPFHIEERLVVLPSSAVEQAAVEIDQSLLLSPLVKGYRAG